MMSYTKKVMFDQDDDYGFFVDLETYNSNKNITRTKFVSTGKTNAIDKNLFSIKEEEEASNNPVKEKIQFYTTIGIFVSGIIFTTLLACNKLI